MKFIVVEWTDPTSSSMWFPAEDIKTFCNGKFTSVGFLVDEDKRFLTITQTSGGIGQEQTSYSNILKLPKGCITKRRNIRWK